MAVACTSMEIHDRRLAISKASASKISKPSPSPLLKSLSSASASASPSLSSPSSSPPRHLPSSITSSPSRPIAKVVNADPSSFRRVVQELTGTTSSTPSSPAGASPRGPSRLQRIAPPPLRAALRNSLADHQQQTLLEQMQQQHQASHILLLQQQHPSKVVSVSPPLSFPQLMTSSKSSLISSSTSQFGNPNTNPNPNPAPGFDPAPQIENPNLNSNPSFSQSLPMLSPHLLSPLPALTPGDSTWANPIDVLAHSPKFMARTSNSMPPLLPLPNLSSNNGYGNGLLSKPAYASKGLNDGRLGSSINSLVTSQGQPLPPLLSTPMQTASFIGVLPPWSPSPLPFSPGSFPPSPRMAPLPTTSGLPLVNNVQYNTQVKYGSMSPNMPNNFTF